jgi:hypothetical protein
MSRGKLDGISYAYVLGGIPAMVALFILLFVFVRACNIPA